MTSNLALWIIIGVGILLLLMVIALVVIGNQRAKAKKVSFEKPEEPKELTQEERSGNYQAKGGFNFAPANPAQPRKEKQPVEASSSAVKKVESKPIEVKPAADKPAADKPAVAKDTPAEHKKPATNDTNRLGAASAAATGGAGAAALAGAAATSNKKDEAKPEAKAGTPNADAKTEAKAEAKAEKPAAVAAKPQGEKPKKPEAAKEEPTKAANEASKEKDAAERKPTQDKNVEEAAVAAGVTAASAAAAKEQTSAPKEGEAKVATEKPDTVVKDAGEQQEEIAPAAGRLGRLRGRLSRSQNAIGKGLLGILSEGDLDEDAWEEVEDTLIMADLGTKSTMKVTDALRERIAEQGVANEAEARAMLREVLIEVGKPDMDRSIKAMPNEGKPAVVMVVGVNGTGKTTTTGKLARVLVSMGHNVLLGAADTFRAAAADQLETWGRRVGASTVRGKEGADPASVAFDAVATGVEQGVDVVLIDTAGRLHTSVGLMDQLGKVKRVVEKKTNVDEVLLVIDATVGQNGLTQARKFREIVDITGVVLTKLDGTAKGGIVFQVQEELGVPVKLVGLGEGADDLAPFEIEGFVDALLGGNAK